MRIKEILNDIISGETEIDYYTPVKVDYVENDIEDKELFYYRMFNPKSSFVEISVNSITKKIVNITLVSINDVEKMMLDTSGLPETIGNPIIDMAIFDEEHIVTNNTEFYIVVENKSKEILVLQKNVDLGSKLVIDNVNLLLDKQSNIVGFIFKGFSEEDWQEISESIEATINLNQENIVKFD